MALSQKTCDLSAINMQVRELYSHLEYLTKIHQSILINTRDVTLYLSSKCISLDQLRRFAATAINQMGVLMQVSNNHN